MSLDALKAHLLAENLLPPEAGAKEADGGGFDDDSRRWVEEFISRHGIQARGPQTYKGGLKWQITCPFNEDHKVPDAAIYVFADGAKGFKCSHDSCATYKWSDFRQHYEPKRDRRIRDPRARSNSASPQAVCRPANRVLSVGASGDVIEATSEWRDDLIYSREGTAKPILANAITALTKAAEWSGVLAFNEFAARVETRHRTPWDKPDGEQWTDNDDRRTAEWLQRQGIFVSTNIAGEAVQTAARESRFHPVRDYLNGVEWDGNPRICRFATIYLAADPEKPIADTFARLWLISAVARVMRPGVKADCCLVLEGTQGLRKSTALKQLAGDWFTDQMEDLGSKDAAMQCRGVWIVEIAELDKVNRSEASRIKAFMSATVDRFRLPYGKNVGEWPRECVFAGTVNHDAYLRDETGGRRFWPIRCGDDIDLSAIERDRDQIWAEAVYEYGEGKSWWLEDAGSIQQAEAEQADRYELGAWGELIGEWLKNPRPRYDGLGPPAVAFSSTSEFVTMPDVLTHCVGKGQQHWTRADEMTVSAALKALGWERKKHPVGYNSSTGKREFQWRYIRSQK